jgi:hypothetical protein
MAQFHGRNFQAVEVVGTSGVAISFAVVKAHSDHSYYITGAEIDKTMS